MKEDEPFFENSRISLIILILSIIVSGFWWLGQVIDVYHFDLVGAIYEILWLPVLALLFILPIVSFIFWVKAKFRLRSLYLYSFLILLMSILCMFLMG